MTTTTMQKFKVFKVDGTVEDMEVPSKDSFHKLQEVVAGFVTYVRLEQGYILVVDEDGLPKQLPINQNATKIAQRIIVGTAVLCHKSAIT